MRWFGLACFIILSILAWRKRDMKHYSLSIVLGALVGLLVDVFGVGMGLWDFPRQPFGSLEYWFIVIPCWGVYGATINMLDDWYMGHNWKSYFITCLVLLAIYEVPNLATASWSYTTSMILVALGWFPLVFLFRVSYLLVVNRVVRVKVLTLLETK